MLNKLWRLCFRLLYNEFAFAYDLVSSAVSLGHWRDWQRTVLRYLSSTDDGPVLELAHGTGDLQADLMRAGYQTVALDLSGYMGKLTSSKLRRAGLPADLIRGDAVQLPCKTGAFASIVCTFPTPFIFSEPVLAEMARVLRPSGRAAVVLVGQLRGSGILVGLISQLYRLTGQRDEMLGQGTVSDLFDTVAFEVESEILTLRSSAVQLALLTKAAVSTESSPDISLDSVVP